MIQIGLEFIRAFSPNEQLVMLQLLLHADGKGVVEFSDRGVSRLTGIPYQQVRTIHQKWIEDGTLDNAGINAGTNAKQCFVTICDFDSYNAINIFSNAVTNAVANALKEVEITKEKENVFPQTPLQREIENNKDEEEIKEEGTKVPKKKVEYPDEYEKDFALYQRKGSKKKGYERWSTLTEEEKESMRRHIPYYMQSNELRFLKDFEGYINQRLFESPVYKGNTILYDPQTFENEQAGVYDPSGWLNYDENFNAWRYFGREPKYDLRDGYTDDNRPDGARVVEQRTVYVWSLATKTWSVTR